LSSGGEVPVSIDVVDEETNVFALEGKAPRYSRPILARKQEDDITLAVVGRGFAAGGLVAGAARFLSYGLGMASVLVALTVALAFFKEGLLKWLRGALPYVQMASALVLILAGAYVIF
jgi:hypothetical protein